MVKIPIATLVLLATIARADTNTLTLAEAKRLAFQRNWDLLAAKSGIDAAAAQLIVAKEFPNPTTSLSTFKIGTHEASTSLGNGLWERSYDTIAAVNQLVEIGGKRSNRQEAGRAGVVGARARFLDAKRTLDQGVTKAYASALLATENARILNDSAGYMRREAEIGDIRLKAGDLSDADFKQILIAVEQFELQAKAAEAAASQSRISVEILMGVTQPKGDWTPADNLEQMDVVASPAIEAKPGAERPDVLAAETDLRGAQAQLKLQRAIRIPDPTFSVGYEHEPPGGGPPVDTFNIGVSFPLPLWNRNGGNIKAAAAAVDQSALVLAKIKAQSVSDLANAEVAYTEASKRLERYQNEIRPQSAKVRESVAFAFEKGGASLVDLLEAERTDNDVRIATAQAMSDTASAVADLIASRNAISETTFVDEEPERKKP